jgi:uncharacterized protein (TIGR03000 family)
MGANWTARLPLVAVAALVVAGLIALARFPPAQAALADDPASGPHYTVVMTEGHNLIVTDNRSNTLYFYTIDKDKEVGSELKLRGSIDLNQVGKPAIRPAEPKAGRADGGPAPGGSSPGAAPPGGQGAPAPPGTGNTATVCVVVPEGAQLWFGDQGTKQTGSVRYFESPPLTPGRKYYYDVKARWRDANGKEVTRTRQVAVRANAVVTVDFTQPGPGG